jgi:CitMHS family citrate-Mg2+:H+ or citrate-Ca2+:H+ symporter
MPPVLTSLAAAADEGYDLAFTPSDGVLVVLGFTMVLTFMALIMTRRLTPWSP